MLDPLFETIENLSAIISLIELLDFLSSLDFLNGTLTLFSFFCFMISSYIDDYLNDESLRLIRMLLDKIMAFKW